MIAMMTTAAAIVKMSMWMKMALMMVPGVDWVYERHPSWNDPSIAEQSGSLSMPRQARSQCRNVLKKVQRTALYTDPKVCLKLSRVFGAGVLEPSVHAQAR